MCRMAHFLLFFSAELRDTLCLGEIFKHLAWVSENRLRARNTLHMDVKHRAFGSKKTKPGYAHIVRSPDPKKVRLNHYEQLSITKPKRAAKCIFIAWYRSFFSVVGWREPIYWSYRSAGAQMVTTGKRVKRSWEEFIMSPSPSLSLSLHGFVMWQHFTFFRHHLWSEFFFSPAA